MQIQSYKQIFFSIFFVAVLFSCRTVPNNPEDYLYEELDVYFYEGIGEITVITEDIMATLHKTPYLNFFDFEIEGIKYTLIEVKMEGGNSLYLFHATDAETWQEHIDSRSKAIFDVAFQIEGDYFRMELSSNGWGYRAWYDVLDETMNIEKMGPEVYGDYP